MIMDKILEQNKPWIDSTWDKLVTKLRKTSVSARDKLPKYATDGVYDDLSEKLITWWTNGFWPGMMWLMYVGTKEDCFRQTAELGEQKLDKALWEKPDVVHHDVGFMWHLTAGANYKITGNETSKNRNLHAAALLAARYNLNTHVIKAWNYAGHDGYTIIDSMMNICQLYWAAEQTNNIAYKQIAMNHADTCLKNHIRPDGSVYHILNYDPITGDFLGEAELTQGYGKGSSWTRGQAWAIYGFVLSYIHTGEQRYLDAAKKVAHYFISAVIASGYMPKSDFRSPDEPAYWDSSAGAITACGLIEIAKAVPEFEKKMYIDAALKILKAIEKDHCDWTDNNESIVQDSSGSYNREVNVSYIFGDYFFTEAIYKLKGFEPLFW